MPSFQLIIKILHKHLPGKCRRKISEHWEHNFKNTKMLSETLIFMIPRLSLQCVPFCENFVFQSVRQAFSIVNCIH